MTAEYQETTIGKIPKDWKVVKAKEIFSLEYGKGLPERQRVFGKYPVVGSNGIVGYHNQALVSGPGIVVGRKGTIGAISWIESDFWPIDTTYYVKLKKENVSLKWLFFKLSHLNLERFNLSDVVPGLKRDLVHKMRFSLPPLAEQWRIVGILSSVDNALRRANDAIAKTERLKKGLMQKLLTEGIGHKEFQETKIGKIPKTWQITKLGQVLELCQYGLSIGMSEKGRYLIVRMDEISDGYVVPHIAKCVDVNEETYKSFKLEKGDVLFNRTNSYELVGRTGIFLLDGDYVFASYLIRLRPKKELLHPLFLTFYLVFSHNRLRRLATKAVHQANINATNLKNFKIVLPSLEEQRKIATIISSVDSKLELDRKRRWKVERIKKGLMNDLLTGRRRVKVAM